MNKTRKAKRHGKAVRRTPFMKYLKYWRYVAGKTQGEVAKDIGISQGAYCEIEKRGKTPRPDLYKPLSESLKRPVVEIVAKLNNVDPNEMEAHGAVAAK